MTIDILIKKLKKIKQLNGNIEFDVIVAKGHEIEIGRLTEGEENADKTATEET